MLGNLIETIEVVKGRIKDHRHYFDDGKPELRTRMSLIDPLLRALEWDVSDPSLVEIEPIIEAGIADYALLRGDGEPVLLLEAKRLSDTKTHHDQLASYVVGENMRRDIKIPYCAMTNGSRWQVFDVFKQEAVLDVSLERHHARKCALTLIGLWQPALREAVLRAVPDLSSKASGNRSGDAVERQRRTGPPSSRSGPPRRNLSEERTGSWTPLDSEAVNPSKHVKPREIRFPDGIVVQVESWRKVLVETARWLFDAGLLDRQDMPFSLTRAMFCVSTNGLRPDGRPLQRPVSVGETGIQVEGNLTSQQVVQFAAALLERSDKVPSQVELKLTN